MALGVAQAIESKSALVAEAGTGVGKTFAYLVPLLLSGKRALVSTATKSLQDQLFLRDLPRLVQVLELDADTGRPFQPENFGRVFLVQHHERRIIFIVA